MNMYIKYCQAAWFILLCLISSCSSSQLGYTVEDTNNTLQITLGELTIEHIIGNLTLPTETGAVYLTILNGTDEDETLLGADIDGCEATEIHEVLLENDVMTMRPVEGGMVSVPAGEVIKLEQGGLHIMCIGKTAKFATGDQIPLTLNFTQAGSLSLTIEVKDISEISMDHQNRK